MIDAPDRRSPQRQRRRLERLRPRPVVADRCIKAVLIFVVLVLLTLFNIWWERRVVARMQHRIGPNVQRPLRPAAVAWPTA